MSKRAVQIEEPGEVATTPAEAAPSAAPAIDDSDPATLLADVAAPTIVETVSPPIIEAPTGHLPDAADVDTSKIKTMTLTKQGWVLPSAAVTHAAG